MSNRTTTAVRLLLVAGIASLVLAGAARKTEPAERPAAVAGRFYAAEGPRLEAGVRAYLADALPADGAAPIAIVAPHAGYVYSGQIAADAWRQASSREVDLIVILGANHAAPAFRGVSIHTGAGYRTPLGLAAIDRESAVRLAEVDEAFRFRPEVHRSEHSVEVHVPFAQVLFPEAKILTAVFGTADLSVCTRFGKALARLVDGRKALIVASSDLAHYPDYDDAVESDHAVLAAMTTLDPRKVKAAIAAEMGRGRAGLATCACGEAPVLAAMVAARELGARRGRVISYANSGDTVLGDVTRVVGYGAVTFDSADGKSQPSPPAPPAPVPPDGELSAEHRRELLEFARETIRRYVESGTAPLARELPAELWRKQGAFVTLEKQHRLRGCIGRREADRPVGQVIGAMALQAAFNDRRFRPLEPEELEQIEIEISLLTPLTRVSGPDSIVVGRDGVLLRKQGHGAIFLPQVAPDQGWTRDQMLEQLCRKAGLPPDCWREGAELHTYQAEVFRESDAGT